MQDLSTPFSDQIVAREPLAAAGASGNVLEMSDGEPVTAETLAVQTGTDERYVREWLCAPAACGHAEYDANRERFSLTRTCARPR
jgi:hypothetical protein